MVLFERDTQLEQLQQIFQEVENGQPRLVILSGEAGNGKTVLLKRFRQTIESRGDTVLWGMCDDLYTPQALAPMYDIAYQLGGQLVELLPEAANLHLIGHELLRTLGQRPQPIVVVVEDIHWADDATLDLIRFLSRRLEGLSIFMILTIREQVKTGHSVQTLLGALPVDMTTRIRLLPFQRETVELLAGQYPAIDGGDLYSLTKGNPFFVTELLKYGFETMPETVRDAVLGRVARLSNVARELVEIVSLVPNHAEVWLVEALGYHPSEIINDPMLRYILDQSDSFFAFRHELARRIVLDSLSIRQRKLRHAEIFKILKAHHESHAVRLARLVHHAGYANLGEEVIRLAPEAAEQAHKVNAYREAAAHYALALQYRHLLPQERVASLLESRAVSSSYIDWEVALSAFEQAQEIRAALGDRYQQGVNYRQMSRLAWGVSQNRMAREYALCAIKFLKKFPPGEALAMAYLQLDHYHMIMGHFSAAGYWNRVTYALSEEIDAPGPLLNAIITHGCVQADMGDIAFGITQLKRVLEMASAQGLREHQAQAHINLVVTLFQEPDFQRGYPYYDEGERFLKEHEMEVYLQYLSVLKGQTMLHAGQWEGALEKCQVVIDLYPNPLGPIGVVGLTTISLILAREGSPAAKTNLNRLDQLLASGWLEPRLVNSIYLAWAEVSWLEGNGAECARWSKALLNNITHKRQDHWQKRGWALLWLWRSGEPVTLHETDIVADPIRLEIAGQWKEAADAWRELGYRYEEGMASAFGDQSGLERAFKIFDQLGARPALDFVRRRMRELGRESIPRGAYTTTRQNKNGLTKRQMDVLELMAEDLTNAEIGHRLHISAKTAEHHVSAILAKLNVSSRDTAVAAARADNLI